MTGSKRRKRIKPFQILNILIMLFLIFITVYPMYYVVVASFSDPLLIRSHTGPLFHILGEPTLQGYQKTLSNKSLFTGFRNTLFYLFVGPFLQLFLTSLAAYVLSR